MGVLASVLLLVLIGKSQVAVLTLCAAYAVVDGVLAIAAAARAAYEYEHWAGLFVEGIAGISPVFASAIWPDMIPTMLTWTVAAWATVTGISAIVTIARLHHRVPREWLLASAGVVTMRFGVLAMGAASSGVIAVVLWAGGNASVFGIVMLILALRLRTGTKKHSPSSLVQVRAR